MLDQTCDRGGMPYRLYDTVCWVLQRTHHLTLRAVLSAFFLTSRAGRNSVSFRSVILY